jgi:hypothetical protein
MAAGHVCGQLFRDTTMREGFMTDTPNKSVSSVPPLVICGPSGVGKVHVQKSYILPVTFHSWNTPCTGASLDSWR